MVNKVSVLSKRDFDKVMVDNKITPENVESFPHVILISINDAFESNSAPYFPSDKKNVRVLFFDDVVEDIEFAWGIARTMTEEQGQTIFDFLNENKNAKHLIVHCAAGISRSGAVGKFAAEFYGINYKEFLGQNRFIHPNSNITRILNNINRNNEKDEGII